MARTNTNDLLAFLAVARERSFTRAAAQLGLRHLALHHGRTRQHGLSCGLGRRTRLNSRR